LKCSRAIGACFGLSARLVTKRVERSDWTVCFSNRALSAPHDVINEAPVGARASVSELTLGP